MPKFLLDSNLSWESRDYLISLGYDAFTTRELNLTSAEDIEIADYAKKRKLIIITLDLDFGKIFHFYSYGTMGIIILRLENQTVESVNEVLKKIIDTKILEKPKFQKALIVVDKNKIRIKSSD